MTEAELQAEAAYRIAERLGIMCGTDTPTPQQAQIAQDEADEWLLNHEEE